MRSVSFVTIASSLSAIFIVVACASSEEAPANPAQPTQDSAPSEPTKLPPPSTGSTAPTPPPKQCVAKCTTDSECQNSCPAASAGVNCCDVSTGTCYTNGSGTCPKPDQDSGTTPPAY